MCSAALEAFVQRRGVRQFVKFCLIGATSAVIDVGLLNLFTQVFGWHWVIAQVLSFTLAVTNGYIWNSRWTFRGMGQGTSRRRYVLFYLTNIIGLLINIGVMKLVMYAITGQVVATANPSARLLNLAKVVAIGCVSLWNFGASKYWTFRPETEPGCDDGDGGQP